MNKGTIVNFYRCYDCRTFRFIEEIHAGKNCPKCGGWHIRYANPTLFAVVKLFIKYPKYIKIFFKENILNKYGK